MDLDAEELRSYLQSFGAPILHNHTLEIVFTLFYGT